MCKVSKCTTWNYHHVHILLQVLKATNKATFFHMIDIFKRSTSNSFSLIGLNLILSPNFKRAKSDSFGLKSDNGV